MIFGKTSEQQQQEEQQHYQSLIFGIKKFAYMPVRLEDGRWIWLSHYHAYVPGRRDSSGEYNVSDDEVRHVALSHHHVRIADYCYPRMDVEEAFNNHHKGK